MLTLKYLDAVIECAVAIKGSDYIHLLDESGKMVACFDGVSDFSQFTLEGGEYTDPTEDHDCYIAVIRDDGTIGKGGHRCSDIGVGLTIKELGTGLSLSEDGTLFISLANGDEVSY